MGDVDERLGLHIIDKPSTLLVAFAACQTLCFALVRVGTGRSG